MMKHRLMKPSIGVVLIALLTDCANKAEYTSVIPQDASLVLGFNLKSMYQKSGLQGESGKKLTATWGNLFLNGLGENNDAKMKGYLKDPQQTGLKLTDKVYVFSGYQSKYFGAVVRVADKGKLKRFLEAGSKKLNNEKGLYYSMNDNSVITFNESALLLLSSQYPSDENLMNQALRLMNDNAKEETSKTIRRVIEANDDMTAYIDLNCIPENYLAQAKIGLPADFRLQDIKFLASIMFEKGKVTVKIENLTENTKLIERFEKQYAVTSKIKGKFMDLFPSNTLCWLCSNMKGKELLEMLKENPMVKKTIQFSDIPVDLERVISSVQGEVAVGINSFAIPIFTIYADVENDNFLSETIAELKPFVTSAGGMVSLHKVNEEVYLFKAYPEMKVWFGMSNHVFFVTSSQFIADHFGQHLTNSLNDTEWGSKVEDNNGFLVLNCKQLLKDFIYSGLSKNNPLNIILQPFDYMEAYSSEWRSVEINFVLKDKQTNLLEQFTRFFSSLN